MGGLLVRRDGRVGGLRGRKRRCVEGRGKPGVMVMQWREVELEGDVWKVGSVYSSFLKRWVDRCGELVRKRGRM